MARRLRGGLFLIDEGHKECAGDRAAQCVPKRGGRITQSPTMISRVLQNLPRARRTSKEHALKAFHDRPLLTRRAGEIAENSVLTCPLVISTTTSSSLEDIVLPVYDEGFC